MVSFGTASQANDELVKFLNHNLYDKRFIGLDEQPLYKRYDSDFCKQKMGVDLELPWWGSALRVDEKSSMENAHKHMETFGFPVASFTMAGEWEREFFVERNATNAYMVIWPRVKQGLVDPDVPYAMSDFLPDLTENDIDYCDVSLILRDKLWSLLEQKYKKDCNYDSFFHDACNFGREFVDLVEKEGKTFTQTVIPGASSSKHDVCWLYCKYGKGTSSRNQSVVSLLFDREALCDLAEFSETVRKDV